MSIYVNPKLAGKVIDLATLDEILCKVTIEHHIDDPKLPIIKELCERLADFAEAYAQENGKPWIHY